jgi:hypothetical protein
MTNRAVTWLVIGALVIGFGLGSIAGVSMHMHRIPFHGCP